MKKFKPTTSGTRGTILPLYRKLLTKTSPNKKLTKGVKRSFGRNNQGRITMRHRGGGHKRRWREIDFMYSKKNIVAKVESVEYDPNRSSFISLVCYEDGERKYIIAPLHIKVGDKIITSKKAPISPGNRMELRNIPVGTKVHNVELKAGGGSKLGRSAGSSIEVIGHDSNYAHLKMPSSETRRVPVIAYASVGEISNQEHHLKVLGKAGRKRHMGRRPIVRGSAMNPVDHPHGGGEGRAGRGRRRAVTKWGKPSGKRQKTRKPKKYSNQSIIRRRKVGKRR